MSRLYIKGIGMMVGMMFGAGMFALPFAFSRAGLFWGVVNFAAVFFILFLLHFLYGEVAFYARGKHRFTGYVEIFLGSKAKQFALFATVASYYGSLLVYGLLGGLFLSNFFDHGAYRFSLSLLFFAVAGILVLLNLKKIANINFYLTIPLFAFIIYLLIAALPAIKAENFLMNFNTSFTGDWFMPYGIWLFSLSGFATLPEVRDIFSKSSIKDFKKVIAASLILSAIFYFLFVIAVWGASNDHTSSEALFGIAKVLGKNAFLAGSLIGLLAVFTSFLAMATDMRNIFRYDYNVPRFWAWLMAVLPPVGLFLLGAVDFARILSLVGALGLGTIGIFIILMARSLRKRIRSGDPGDLLKPDNGNYTKPTRFIEILAIAGILSGVAYQLWQIFA
ncbi:MAG: hypothetical protein GXP44_01870 [bacterium]|nr:hypothetical protein [bacterium]